MIDVFTPIEIGSLQIKNRFMLAPMENGLAHPGGEVSSDLITFYFKRAQKGVGILITGSVSVSPEGSGLPTQLAIYDNKYVAGLEKLCEAVHGAGSKIGIQLYHAGRQATQAVTGLQPIAPSAIPCDMLANDPKEMTASDMADIKNKFVTATARSIKAGFDLIEIHFAHGYLLHSFLSPHSNRRTDSYGGVFENRCRYPMEVFESVIEAAGNIPVTIRISADEYLDDGLGFAEVKKICKLAQDAGAAAVSLSAGSYDAMDYCIQPASIPQGFLVPYAKELKMELDIPIIVAARLNNADMIEKIIQDKKADMVAIGRGLIADEDLVIKIGEKRYGDIQYCVACNQGCIGNVLQGKGVACPLNISF